jgi:hypothetical protein
MSRNYQQEFQKLLTRDGSQRPSDLFTSFCRTASIAIQQPFANSEKLEQEYLSIVGRYKRETVHLFPEMLANITLALEENPEQDYLGSIFHLCEFHNTWKGQFFTPYPISKFMAGCVIGELTDILKTKRYVAVQEPACGSGGMLVAVRNEFVQQKRNLSTELWCTAIDVDRLCADMCYIQLSLLGVAAEVIWGNTLSMEIWNVMKTPIHHWMCWDNRLQTQDKELAEQVVIPDIVLPEPTVNAKGQFEMF